MSDAVTLANDAIALFNKRITDEIFLLIQEDRALMKRYLDLVDTTSLKHVNTTIGKQVKERYGLTNAERQAEPRSTLIQSHQQFE